MSNLPMHNWIEHPIVTANIKKTDRILKSAMKNDEIVN